MILLISSPTPAPVQADLSTDVIFLGTQVSDSRSIAWGDWDGDGDLDAFVAKDLNAPNTVWLNDGSGDFGASAHDTFGAGDSTSVALGDVDGDGDLDLAAAGDYSPGYRHTRLVFACNGNSG